ncbi:MAG: flagellar biosynthesis protein FlhF [Rhodothermaceae bacterium]|nr:flagellar biosynthesis protein FlhF [Rhodothermaceae bacterium]
MQIKTITGSSIQAALAEARVALGDDVVLLESVAATADQPARITVMLDPAPARKAPVARPEPAGMGFGYTAAPRAAAAPAPSPEPRRPLYTPPVAPAGPSPEVLERLDHLATRLDGFDHLAARFDQLEQRLGAALAGTASRWAAQPLHSALLRQGLAQATVTGLFDAVAARGVDLDRFDAEGREAVRWALAHELRERLAPTAPARHTADTLVAVGPGGTGKTTLLLRLATDARFYGRRDVGVLTILPADAPVSADPAAPYRAHGLAARTVRTAEEIRQALDLLHGTDVLLIDTPALPTARVEAEQTLDHIAMVLAPLTAFEVVLTLDAARARLPFAPEALDRLPLVPTMTALTRLDEADDWGRIAEWLLALNRPVAFTTAGEAAPLHPHSPARFAEAFLARLDA